MRKMNWKNVVVGLMIAVISALALMPTTEAAIGFPGRQEQATTATVAENAEITATVPEEQKAPVYTAIVCRLDDGKVVAEMYDISGQQMAKYFEQIQAKHNNEFVLMCTDGQEFQQKLEELKALKDKAEVVTEAGKIPAEVEEVLTQQLGTENVYAARIQYKDPNHKSWLEKFGKTVLGAVIPFAGGLF